MTVSRIIVVAVVAVFVAGCPLFDMDDGEGTGSTDPSIKIGVAGAHSGEYSQYGTPAIHAAELVIAGINESGRLLGQQVELVTADSECNSNSAPGAAQTLIDAGVIGVVGHTCSGATEAALSEYESSGIPVISPSSTRTSLTDGTYPFFFRTIVPDDELTQQMVDGIVAESATSKVYLAYDKNATYWDSATIERVEGEISTDLAYEGTIGLDFTTELSSAAGTIETSAADVVMMLPGTDDTAPAEAADFVDALRGAGFTGSIVITDNAYDQTLVDDLVTSGNTDSVYVMGGKDKYATTAAGDLRQAHQDEYGESPGPFFIEAAAALEVIVAAVEEANSTDPATLVSTITDGTFTTVLGDITFTDGDPSGGQTGYSVFNIVEGAFAEYTPGS